MESSEDLLCRRFLENSTINPRTGRSISKNKDIYNSLVKLCIKRKFDVSSLNPTQIPVKSSDKIWSPVQKPIKSSNKIWIPVQKSVSIINDKSPDDLLQLYLDDVKIVKSLDNKTIINELNKKYDTNIDTDSFIEWFKYYNYVNVPKNVKYLYMLENEQFIDPSYLDKFKNSEVTETMIYILFNWINMIIKHNPDTKLSYFNYCHSCTLLYIIFSKIQTDIKKEKLQIYALLVLYYSDIIFNDEDIKLELEDLQTLSENAYDVENLKLASIEVFNILSGRLIYPSPIFFIDQKNNDLIELVELASSIPEISIYKPSLIAHTCTYMMTGKYTIYTIDEMTDICSIIWKVLKRSLKSSLETYRNRAIDLTDKIKIVCKEKSNLISSQPIYKYNEPWHLGEFEELESIGEGGYGEIFLIKRKLCGNKYVIKTMDYYYIDSFLLETSILKLLANQPNIISICGFIYDVDQTKIILPLMKGSVHDLVKGNYLDKSKYNKYFHQILLGIEQCHNHDLIHRDIKPQNILYNEKEDNMLIIDLGISVCYQSSRNITDTNYANTLNYRPPEGLLFENKKYSQEIDIWSVGCVFYFMMTGNDLITVYIFDDNEDILNKMFNKLGTPTEDTWPGITATLKELNISHHDFDDTKLIQEIYPFDKLILDCLTFNPKNRPIIDELLLDYKLIKF